ncbi:DUF3293 domain-containing protein [Aeromonas caviae]|uniref:DUF3293 domain-containing protein n=1 Tax=Aeromonas caviae TaxID=648 RepID=UPI0009BA7FF6|nr:DUF3293 domain-containing protein [Aeromonas caviae]MDX7762007.1 DUF3293 domain-containing protein [Aeromonas caviae]MDX7797628.1 DUF3293 domain-containing protein [Aeromonas caviae]QDO76564.1 DUF3293 domain-containing protein [Aeromonas caviae]
MTLWENYRKVCFIAPFAPPHCPAYAIITAWNPASQWVGLRRNARRQRALVRQVGECLVMGEVWGSDEDERWQEASLLLPLSQPEAIRLAARFGQNALYWVREGELWLVPVLLEGMPCHLGTLASRWRFRLSG